MIQQDREIRKVLVKSTWYLPRERHVESDPTPNPGWGYRGGSRKGRSTSTTNPYAPKAPLFVPRTHNGALIGKLRQVEERLSGQGGKLTTARLELVEQAGLIIKTIVIDEDPCSSRPCAHHQCTKCLGDKPGDCRTRSVVYSNTCLICKSEGRDTKNLGETGRTMLERSREH